MAQATKVATWPRRPTGFLSILRHAGWDLAYKVRDARDDVPCLRRYLQTLIVVVMLAITIARDHCRLVIIIVFVAIVIDIMLIDRNASVLAATDPCADGVVSPPAPTIATGATCGTKMRLRLEFGRDRV